MLTYSPDSDASQSQPKLAECEPSQCAKSNPTAAISSGNNGRVSRSTRTRKNLTGRDTEASGSSQAVLLVSQLPLPGSDEARAITAGFGQTLCGLLGKPSPLGSCFENPPGINGVGLDGVLADLEAQDYEARTLNIPACAVNSPQRRERLWIVGHSASDDRGLLLRKWKSQSRLPDTGRTAQNGIVGHTQEQSERVQDLQTLPNARRDARGAVVPATQRSALANSLWSDFTWVECGDGKRRRAKPGVCGLASRTSVGLLEALGNAIVWPIAARIIHAMIQAEELHP